VCITLVEHALYVGFWRVRLDGDGMSNFEVSRRRITDSEQRAIVVIRFDLRLLKSTQAVQPGDVRGVWSGATTERAGSWIG
jgi:hypothetical protein